MAFRPCGSANNTLKVPRISTLISLDRIEPTVVQNELDLQVEDVTISEQLSLK
jgi:hypothetical protein